MRSVAAAAVLLGAGLVAGHCPGGHGSGSGADGLGPLAHGPRSGAQGARADEPEGSCPNRGGADCRWQQLGALGAEGRFFGRLDCRDLPESRTSDLLARHRIEIAGLGAAAFAAVVIGFLLG